MQSICQPKDFPLCSKRHRRTHIPGTLALLFMAPVARMFLFSLTASLCMIVAGFLAFIFISLYVASNVDRIIAFVTYTGSELPFNEFGVWDGRQ